MIGTTRTHKTAANTTHIDSLPNIDAARARMVNANQPSKLTILETAATGMERTKMLVDGSQPLILIRVRTAASVTVDVTTHQQTTL